MLREFLDCLPASIQLLASALTDVELRAPLPPSNLTVGEMLKHLPWHTDPVSTGAAPPSTPIPNSRSCSPTRWSLQTTVSMRPVAQVENDQPGVCLHWTLFT